MAQEFYIDENGNKIPISGTVNSADMLPMSASDDTKVSEAIGAYSTTDFTANAEYTWSQIIHAEGTTQFQIIRKGQIGIINVRFATSGAIDSGALNIPNSPPTAYTEVRSAITSKDGKTGFIQYSGNTFVIRCQASSNVFAGSLVFPIG